jgi:hypothetical protein
MSLVIPDLFSSYSAGLKAKLTTEGVHILEGDNFVQFPAALSPRIHTNAIPPTV